MPKSDNSKIRRELGRVNKEVDQLSTTVGHLKSCKAVYVFTATVRKPDRSTTVTIHRPSKKEAVEAMNQSYLEVTGKELTQHTDFVRYEDKEREIWATFEIYKPRMT